MSSHKFVAIFVLVFSLAGCGFQPLHGRVSDGRSTQAALSQVRVEIVRDRLGQVLRNFLLDRLSPRGVSAEPRWSLEVQMDESIVSLGVLKTSEATRANLWVRGTFLLVPLKDQGDVFSGSLESVSSFDIQSAEFGTLSAEFGTLSAEKDVRRRALLQMSDDLVSRISVYFRRVLERGEAS